jgi:hypothetical protein
VESTNHSPTSGRSCDAVAGEAATNFPEVAINQSNYGDIHASVATELMGFLEGALNVGELHEIFCSE